MTGDIFEEVDLGGGESGSVVIAGHPCVIRGSGGQLARRVPCCVVGSGEPIDYASWPTRKPHLFPLSDAVGIGSNRAVKLLEWTSVRRAGSSDASGNVRLQDIQRLLQQRITEDFAAHELELNLKLLDPSYLIRSVPANPYDSVYCVRLAHVAVHAALAGRTEVVVGRWRGRFVHIPIPVAVSRRSTVDPDGDLWLSALESTGQPARWRPKPEPAAPGHTARRASL